MLRTEPPHIRSTGASSLLFQLERSNHQLGTALHALQPPSHLSSRWAWCACAQAALNLVADLMEHNTTCFREGVDLLLRIHFTQPYTDTVWGLPPATVARCAGRAVRGP